MKKLTLNEKIALILHKGSKLQLVPLSDISGQTMTCLNNSCRPILNYTGNWNDLMPYVEKYRLIIVPYKDDLWESYPESGEFVIYNKKYLRAGAECLLKVLEAK